MRLEDTIEPITKSKRHVMVGTYIQIDIVVTGKEVRQINMHTRL
jgi:hypothetical protein